jgi:hypothetical protein
MLVFGSGTESRQRCDRQRSLWGGECNWARFFRCWFDSARIEEIASKAKVTFVVANNHSEAKAGVNALQLKYSLTGRRVTATETLLEDYPELKNIADPMQEGQMAGLPLLRNERAV